jgi:hypothetical protein
MAPRRQRTTIDSRDRACLATAPRMAEALRSPEELRSSPKLTSQEKVEALQRWAANALERVVADEEGMPGGGDDDGEVLRRVLIALDSLADEREAERGESPHSARTQERHPGSRRSRP